MEGMKAARSIALLSYRNYETYKSTKQQGVDSKDGATYQRHQGDKLAKRFNAFSYWYLSKAMDSHDISRGRGSVEAALKNNSESIGHWYFIWHTVSYKWAGITGRAYTVQSLR